MAAKPDNDAAIEELEDRDPHSINPHLQVLWGDIIGEPEGTRSPECAWRVSNSCFKYSKNCCYIFLSVIIAPIVALVLGLSFACLAFEHIWCVSPCLRILKISCAAFRTAMRAVAQGCIVPIASAIGTVFGGFKLQHHALSEPPEKDDLIV